MARFHHVPPPCALAAHATYAKAFALHQADPSLKIQREAYAHFASTRFPAGPIHAAIVLRLRITVGPLAPAVWARLALGVGKPHTLVCAWRTLMNAWPTTCRLHVDNPSKCVLGCDAPDDMVSHYWSACAPFACLLREAWGQRVADPSFVRAWASESRLDIVASAYTAYAALAQARRQGYAPNFEDVFISARSAHASA